MKRILSDRIIFGVCSGIAKELCIEPIMVRLVFLILALMGFGLPILVYIALAILMPADK
jgi:phage shock protein PspC (stress-responsive transcriptional regulator)